MKCFTQPSPNNEAIRITFAITACMMLGKLLALDSAVYLALYPTIIMTKSKDYSWRGLTRTFVPTLLAASSALVVSETFSDHPFIIWTISLFFLDFMRRQATSPAKMGAMLMPTFNWILIVVFAQHSSTNMAMRIHEILTSMAITILVCKLAVYCFPIPSTGKPNPPSDKAVSAQQRLIFIGLVGVGVGFLMQVEMLSATFCLVPVIAAATQNQISTFKQVVERRFITQVGGCAIAAIFSLLLLGHQSVVGGYTLLLAGLIFVIATMMTKSDSQMRDLHADALLATMLPIQLYISHQNLGLERTFLRGWQLMVTLAILYALCCLVAHYACKPKATKPSLSHS
ncbi:DUF2955 domain-containing protein [Vibrio sp. LaRot3]|uniref:DUF2955 domain-containing protein n=1 Tax=Vibrio sp. LaRot3 TaxID=2998829 RepID=UPI0022CDC501|nr:DUF2955 domain-containing protein [Vibrio sp. LaRot3]MDA0149838.1 DUF2955 domain-containing protein [Vibrio sp. LaRot3]